MKRFSVIPTPAYIEEPTGFIPGLPDIASLYAGGLLSPAADAVREYAARVSLKGDPGRKVSLNYSASFSGEAWMIRNDRNGTSVLTGSVEGAQRALAVLFQIILQYREENGLPMFEIKSAPDTDYRAVMIDLSRNWHQYPYLIEYADMCWLYGIRYLHLHFTDDQDYTLPSAKYPKIPAKEHSYTRDQIAELDTYAASRGIEIVPEIDVPGHCTPFTSAYGELFGNGQIIMQTSEAMSAMKELFTELCGMFPHSHYIHVGGDEARIWLWTENEACREYAERCGIDFDMEDKRELAERMLANFVDEMAGAVRSMGRTPVAWEGFKKSMNAYVNHDILMESWENYYQPTTELLDGGFDIINSSWRPMYIVTPKRYWSLEEVYDWSIYSWYATHPSAPEYLKAGIRIEPDGHVRGGQLLAWGDFITDFYPDLEEGLREEQKLVEERAAILSERTWNTEKLLPAEEFLPVAAIVKDMLQEIKLK